MYFMNIHVEIFKIFKKSFRYNVETELDSFIQYIITLVCSVFTLVFDGQAEPGTKYTCPYGNSCLMAIHNEKNLQI